MTSNIITCNYNDLCNDLANLIEEKNVDVKVDAKVEAEVQTEVKSNTDDSIVGILIMIKNEEKSIGVTLKSTHKYFKHIIVYDTGSTDNTIQIVKDSCKNNNQILHLKKGIFKGYPESRNVSLEFAESVNVSKLILMDAGDEFQTHYKPAEFLNIIKQFPCICGIVKKKWLADTIEEHSDIRFISNHKGLRYDLDYPVHEMIKYNDCLIDGSLNGGGLGGSGKVSYNIIGNLSSLFILYQDRNKYGASTEKRYTKDIDLLLKAKPNKRNLFFLAQSYMSINDFHNGYKYNLLSIKNEGKGEGEGEGSDGGKGQSHIDNTTSYIRAGYCAMMCKYSEHKVIDNLQISIKISAYPPIDPYIYILKYYMDNNKPEKALPFVDDLFKLDIKHQSNNQNVNYHFYDYVRWNLISVVCLMCNAKLDTGYAAIKKIIHFGKPNDIQNMQLYDRIMTSSCYKII